MDIKFKKQLHNAILKTKEIFNNELNESRLYYLSCKASNVKNSNELLELSHKIGASTYYKFMTPSGQFLNNVYQFITEQEKINVSKENELKIFELINNGIKISEVLHELSLFVKSDEDAKEIYNIAQKLYNKGE